MGQWLTTIEDIKGSAASFFEMLFSSERDIDRHPVLPFTLPSVSQGDNESLLALLSMDEVQEVVFSINSDSAPGPDGIGFGFYLACWGIIKEELVAAVQDFFNGGWLPKGVTSTLIVLMPKTQGASHWQDFRPINLCNVNSKIISKLLSNRLNRLLPQLISHWQTGFFPGRQIIDNILLAQEHTQELDRRLEISNLMLKLDIEKAYDRVEWSFLLFMLRAFGFQENVIDSIFRMAGGLKVPYLAFADDVIVFTRLSKETLEALFPLVYLGVTISQGRCSSIAFDGIIAKVRARVCHSSMRLLSTGGKLILLKHVLNSMPLYLLQLCFPTEKGGLGLRSLDDMVKAFYYKLWWRLHQRESIWSDFMFSKYIRDQYPLQAAVARLKGTWKRLNGIQEMTEAHISWSLGPGMVDFWLDTWCELGPLRTLVSTDRDNPHFLVAEFLGREGWNRDRLLQRLLDHLVDSIVDIPFDLEGQDRIMWA
ncbi:uncharacterized protein [Coffea arabica]|uniref:Reverse transcriptase domain-containing protein n=1 Tax=Coffea arabica TaxID=13443 RepID=A0ABM4UR29_COFAR